MNRARLWVAAGIIALVVLVSFAFSAPHTHDVAVTQSANTAASVPTVALHDAFKKDTHTITGSLDVPNACTTVSAVAATTSEGIRVMISVQAEAGVCLQLPTRANFSATLAAPAHAPITATVNGVRATTTSS